MDDVLVHVLLFLFLQGNTGKDDDVVQTYMVQASEGDVGSMLALGEMNYYGTRGIPRVSGWFVFCFCEYFDILIVVTPCLVLVYAIIFTLAHDIMYLHVSAAAVLLYYTIASCRINRARWNIITKPLHWAMSGVCVGLLACM